jgi:DNA topoisomerase IA
VDGRQRLRYPPAPLATLALQKEAITHLRMPGERCMKLAEELYQEGVISYPRTETDVFDPAYDLKVILPIKGGLREGSLVSLCACCSTPAVSLSCSSCAACSAHL